MKFAKLVKFANDSTCHNINQLKVGKIASVHSE